MLAELPLSGIELPEKLYCVAEALKDGLMVGPQEIVRARSPGRQRRGLEVGYFRVFIFDVANR